MKTIGNYEVLREVAQGGMGSIYRARDPHLGRDVAIKVIRDTMQSSERHRKRFQREAKALAKLRHPGIVSVHMVGEQEGQPYLVMDWVEGESLQARLDREGPMAPRLAADVVRRLAETLEHAHSEGVLHRDLKPENVLITTEGNLRLTDFGLSKDLNATSTGTQLSLAGAYLGTPGYWPPEQALGKLSDLGPHSDVYALGATLYALLTGQPPFVAGCKNIPEVIRRMSEGPPRPPSELRAGIAPGLEALCLKAMDHEPSKRFASAADLAAALEEFVCADGEPMPVLAPAPTGADPFSKTAVEKHAEAGGSAALAQQGLSGLGPPTASTERRRANRYLLYGVGVLIPASVGIIAAVTLRLSAVQEELAASRAELAEGKASEQRLEGQVIASAVERDDARRRVAELELELDRVHAEARAEVETLEKAASEAQVKELLARLSSPDRAAHEGVVPSLIRLGSEAVPGLVRALADERPAVRRAVCQSLGGIGGSDAYEALRLVVSEDPDASVREVARGFLE